MAGLTLATAEAALNSWVAADAALAAGGQSVRHESGRMLTRADSAEIRNNIDYWNKQCQQLGGSVANGGAGRSRVVSAGW